MSEERFKGLSEVRLISLTCAALLVGRDLDFIAEKLEEFCRKSFEAGLEKGHASRDAEVERLKAELEAEKRRAAAYRRLAIYYSACAELRRILACDTDPKNLEDAEAPVDAEAQDILAKSGGEKKT